MNQIITNLNRLTDKKIELFKEIQNITFKQKEDIEKNSADNINKLLEEKQKVINTVDEVDKAFTQQYQLLKKNLGVDNMDSVDTAKYPGLKELKSKVEEVLKIASSVMEVENENKDRMKDIYDKLKSEINLMNTGKKSLKAYTPPVFYQDGIYIDKKK